MLLVIVVVTMLLMTGNFISAVQLASFMKSLWVVGKFITVLELGMWSLACAALSLTIVGVMLSPSAFTAVLKRVGVGVGKVFATVVEAVIDVADSVAEASGLKSFAKWALGGFIAYTLLSKKRRKDTPLSKEKEA